MLFVPFFLFLFQRGRAHTKKEKSLGVIIITCLLTETQDYPGLKNAEEPAGEVSPKFSLFRFKAACIRHAMTSAAPVDKSGSVSASSCCVENSIRAGVTLLFWRKSQLDLAFISLARLITVMR